jgi:endoglucanase
MECSKTTGGNKKGITKKSGDEITMIKRIALTTIICCISFLAFAQPKTPVEKNGALHVANGQLVNQFGVPPQLRGISFSWSIWKGRKYYNPATVDWLCTDFKVSIIRLAMAIEPDTGYLQRPQEQQQLITKLVDQAVKDGIYVLIDWHDHNADKHLSQSKQFFAEMAKRYNKVPNVIYEIWNEPKTATWDTIKSYAKQVIAEIRKYDADNLVIVGSPHWDQDVDIAAVDPILGFSNIAYSFHFYASDKNHQERLRAKANRAIKSGLPLFVTEWGVGESDGNGSFNRDENAVWLKWLEDNKLSWANWNITDKVETTALLKPGASESGDWPQNDLTPAGVYIREIIRKFNKGD